MLEKLDHLEERANVPFSKQNVRRTTFSNFSNLCCEMQTEFK